MGSDSSGLRKLTGKGGFEPAWSLDGKRILFHLLFPGGNRSILSVDSNGDHLELLTSGMEGRISSVHSVDQQPLR